MRDALSVLLTECEDVRFRIAVSAPVVEQLARQLVQLLLVVPAQAQHGHRPLHNRGLHACIIRM
ncbi:hypothetical protein D3C85_1838180 [compost metagenome]